jgi:prolyl-tRNA editing enzyme YbaK/EbsC (Cys-tRNA(Pro) deacylase)
MTGSPTVVDALREAGVVGEVREFSESTRTAADAARALGCAIGAIANSLVFMGDGEARLVMTSGAHRVDLPYLAAELGLEELRRASADEVRAATGQVIGGVAPIGHPTSLRTLVDRSLEQYPVIWAAAGTAHSVFPTTFAELVRITDGDPVQVTPDD